MNNLSEKEKCLWYYNYFLDLAKIVFGVYQKTKDKENYDFGIWSLKKAKDYKLSLKKL